tara:strand:- start:8904 stop:9662 length:759 start_codon:yes stop_codon:yes gene_type:complete
MMLKAREIINTDEQELFQVIKNNSYRHHQALPKVYLYNSSVENFFIFESKKGWIIVLSRKLLEQLDREKKEDLVELAYQYKKSKITKLKTKCLGLSTIYQIMIHGLSKYLKEFVQVLVVLFIISLVDELWAKILVGLLTWGGLTLLQKVWMKIFLINKEEDFKTALYKAFYVFLTFLSKPFFLPIDYILGWSKKIKTSNSLKPFALMNNEVMNRNERIMTNVIITNRNFEQLIISYMERFPIFSECEFESEF